MTAARPTPEQFQLDQLRAEVARLAAENVGLRQQLSDAQDDANSWQEEAAQLRKAMPNHDDCQAGLTMDATGGGRPPGIPPELGSIPPEQAGIPPELDNGAADVAAYLNRGQP